MAPPFFPDDTDEEEGRNREEQIPDISSNFPHRAGSNVAYEGNVLADPALFVNEDTGIEKGRRSTAEKEGKGEKTVNRLSRYEHTKNFNKVIVEIPLVLEKGIVPQLRLSENARLSMHSHVPPSSPEGRFSASASGNCRIHQAIGSSNGSIEATYKASPHIRLIGALDIASAANTRPLNIQVGAQYKEESNQSTVQVTASQQGRSSWGIAVSTRDVMDPWIVSSRVFWRPVKNQWKSIVSLQSMTTHILRLSLGWTSSTDHTLSFPLNMLQLTVDPKLSLTRRAPVSIQYNPINGSWNANATVQTTRHKPNKKTPFEEPPVTTPSSWRVGIQRALSSWSIIVAWQQGDITLRVPILLGAIAGSGVPSKQAPTTDIIATATPFVVCAIVGVAHEMISRFIWGDPNRELSPSETSEASPDASTTISATKAKQDAAAQQTLMKRQAEARNTTEVKKNGLVIESALYQSGDTSWDVTTPLQFWVSTETSTLSLAAGSKQHLLGFYSLPNPDNNVSEAKNQTHVNDKQPSIPWWQEYYTPTRQRTSQALPSKDSTEESVPTLLVQYSYQGKAFDTTIGDKEPLNLPLLDIESAKS